MLGFAISGRAGSGKSRFASFLAAALAYHGLDSRVCPFAAEGKHEVFQLYGVTKADPGGRDKIIAHLDGMRAIDPDHWIRGTERVVVEARSEGFVPIVDDLRFVREMEWCRMMGLVTVRLDVPPATRERRLRERGEDPRLAHSMIPGESVLDFASFHYRIDANGKPGWVGCMARAVVTEQLSDRHAKTPIV